MHRSRSAAAAVVPAFIRKSTRGNPDRKTSAKTMPTRRSRSHSQRHHHRHRHRHHRRHGHSGTDSTRRRSRRSRESSTSSESEASSSSSRESSDATGRHRTKKKKNWFQRNQLKLATAAAVFVTAGVFHKHNADALANLTGTHKKTLANLTGTHADALANLTGTHKKTLANLTGTHADALANLAGTHKKTLANLTGTHTKALENAVSDAHIHGQKELNTQADGHDTAIQVQTTNHHENLSFIKNQMRTWQEAAAEAKKIAHTRSMKIHTTHTNTIKKLGKLLTASQEQLKASQLKTDKSKEIFAEVHGWNSAQTPDTSNRLFNYDLTPTTTINTWEPYASNTTVANPYNYPAPELSENVVKKIGFPTTPNPHTHKGRKSNLPRNFRQK
jgi:hypothetical protein